MESQDRKPGAGSAAENTSPTPLRRSRALEHTDAPASEWGPELTRALHGVSRLRHIARRTEKAYRGWMRRLLAANNWRHPRTLGRDDVTAFLSDLATERHVSVSTQNQALASLPFLYRHVLIEDLPWLDEIIRPKRPRRVPVVLSRHEVSALRGQLQGNPLHVATLLYGAGLRLLEALQLRI